MLIIILHLASKLLELQKSSLDDKKLHQTKAWVWKRTVAEQRQWQQLKVEGGSRRNYSPHSIRSRGQLGLGAHEKRPLSNLEMYSFIQKELIMYTVQLENVKATVVQVFNFQGRSQMKKSQSDGGHLHFSTILGEQLGTDRHAVKPSLHIMNTDKRPGVCLRPWSNCTGPQQTALSWPPSQSLLWSHECMKPSSTTTSLMPTFIYLLLNKQS